MRKRLDFISSNINKLEQTANSQSLIIRESKSDLQFIRETEPNLQLCTGSAQESVETLHNSIQSFDWYNENTQKQV